jgi:hypothetical protein
VNKDPEFDFGLPPLPSPEPEQPGTDGSLSDEDRDQQIEERFRKEFEDGPGDNSELSQMGSPGVRPGPRPPRRPLNGEQPLPREWE